MKSNPILAFLALIALTACQKPNETKELIKELNLGTSKSLLENAAAQDILITDIDQVSVSSSTIVHFEDQSSALLNNAYLLRIEKDPGEWQSRFYFVDGTVTACPMLCQLKMDSTMIALDPFHQSPLSALATVSTPVKGRFKVVVPGKGSSGVTISNLFDNFGTSHRLAILGLYANYTNHVNFIFTDQFGRPRDSVTINIRTAALPISPAISITKRSDFSDQGLYFVASIPIAYDQHGDIRWYYSGDFSSLYQKLNNGNVLMTINAGATAVGTKSFNEVSMLGQVIKKYIVPNFQHHEIIELPSGNFLVGSNSHPEATPPKIEDLIVELDRSTGAVVKSWDFNQILDPGRPPLPDAGPGDWMHLNSIYFDKTDNSLVVSSRSQCAVVKVDYAGGEIKWVLSNHNGWSDKFANVLLQPATDSLGSQQFLKDFWTYGQHSARRIANGNLLLYDDGDFREYYDDPQSPEASYTRIVQYKINENEKSVDLVWQFSNDKSVFTQYTGYTDYLPNGNYLVAYMFGPGPNTPRVIEVNESGFVMFESTINPSANYYRTYKYDIYKNVTEGSSSL